MNDLISRKWLMECVNEGWIKFDTEKDKNIYVHLVRDIAPSAQPEQAIKDCRNCKFGDYNDHWNTNFCYCSCDCNNWDKWEPSAQPEIIYCKDCKWKQGAECVRFADVRPFPSDFCSRAERREE